MATMTTTDRAAVHADFMRDLSRILEPCAVLKADGRAAVDALDQFLSDNATVINSAIPQPARGALTQAQKARLLMLVIQRRYLTGV